MNDLKDKEKKRKNYIKEKQLWWRRSLSINALTSAWSVFIFLLCHVPSVVLNILYCKRDNLQTDEVFKLSLFRIPMNKHCFCSFILWSCRLLNNQFDVFPNFNDRHLYRMHTYIKFSIPASVRGILK